ncbi:MAG: hypothetical protein ACKVT0_09515 [Planctomycetaceae bacterium]
MIPHPASSDFTAENPFSAEIAGLSTVVTIFLKVTDVADVSEWNFVKNLTVMHTLISAENTKSSPVTDRVFTRKEPIRRSSEIIRAGVWDESERKRIVRRTGID